MAKLLGFIGATVGGTLGWWLGGHVGVMTAFLLSVCGSGLGLYGGRQVARGL